MSKQDYLRLCAMFLAVLAYLALRAIAKLP